MTDPQMILRLPKWAQQHIHNIQRERDLAVSALNEFTDTQTPSRVWVEDYVCTGEAKGPTVKRHYVQSHKVTFSLGDGVEVDVGFDLQRKERDSLQMMTSGGVLAIYPQVSNSVKLKVGRF